MLRKSKNELFRDLIENTELLSEACERFRNDHKLNEIRNIALRLRILVGNGKGNNLLWEFAEKKSTYVFALTLCNEIRITEVEDGTDEVLQTVRCRALADHPDPSGPTIPIVTNDTKFSPWLENVKFSAWLENGFLLDWQQPNMGQGTPKTVTLTPSGLIHSFAGKEAAHSDRAYDSKLGAPFESFAKNYVLNGKRMRIPVIYNYLYQIGQVVVGISNRTGKQALGQGSPRRCES